ncbi:tRNA lysidine(34) synthetase TilS [Anaerococcus vaginalis]|uniref:tRNA lysidine(34) synthetase TilS n=1 Tax=Anaerococcus vaginalis TaxID=33037 RepID=UPI002907B9F9|nr:tRNA lysidine(34) synthetase TilS [Anaerococcus vaginalis]MDU5372471.1 tRNA lysidine(34) synthetase TilS [Anaerococcus vaginalis]
MCTKTKIINKFKSTIEKNNLIEKNDTIIVGASGGPDSQFLIYLLNEVKDYYKINIVLAHLNHLHRLDASEDEKLVEKTGEKLGFKTFIDHKSMDDYAKKEKISAENAGRILRYDFFRSIKNKYKNAKIAVAHNKDDQAETVLMRIIRGSGLDGLRAMDYKNKDIIRPIMDFTKSEILKFLDEEKISYHIDYTNLETDYTRNKIRLEMLPYIQDNFNSSISESIYRTVNILKDSKEIIDDVTNFKYKKLVNQENGEYFIDVNLFEREKKSVKRNIIRKLLIELNGSNQDIRMVYIDDIIELLDLKNGSQYVFKGYSFFKSYDKVIIRKNLNNKKNQSVKFELGEISFGDFKINSYLTENTNVKPSRNKMIFDSKILSNNLFLRKRKNGDRIKLKGFTKKVKAVFIDNKIAQIKRDNYPILSDEENVYAILSLKRSNLYMKNDNSKEVLVIEVTYEK